MSEKLKAELRADMAQIIKDAEMREGQADLVKIEFLETALLKMAGVVNQLIEKFPILN